jgi:hypothetical protein
MKSNILLPCLSTLLFSQLFCASYKRSEKPIDFFYRKEAYAQTKGASTEDITLYIGEITTYLNSIIIGCSNLHDLELSLQNKAVLIVYLLRRNKVLLSMCEHENVDPTPERQNQALLEQLDKRNANLLWRIITINHELNKNQSCPCIVS